jgi:lipopolysaccharide export system protein LptC
MSQATAMDHGPRTLARLLRRGGRLLQRGWEAVSIYLPVLLMGVLALATYWMVQRTPAPTEPAPSPQPRGHEVSFFMRGALIKTYDPSGRLQNELSGTEIRHYGDDKSLEVDQPRLLSVSPDAWVTRASAQRALIQDEGANFQLMGQAVVVREAGQQSDGRLFPRLELRGEFLIIGAREQWLRSPQPAVLTSGQDRFSADSLSYDHRTRVAELTGRVKATLMPR